MAKAKKAYPAIYQSLNIYNGARPKRILKAIDMMVFPILTYGCEVWAPFIHKHSLDDLLRNSRDKMEKFHKNAKTLLELQEEQLILSADQNWVDIQLLST